MRALSSLTPAALLLGLPASAEEQSTGKGCGHTLAACDVEASRALMTGDGFALAVAEPMPPKLAATFVGLAVAGKRHASCLRPQARASLTREQIAWLGNPGGAASYEPAKTGADLLIVTPKAVVARKATFERLDGRKLPFKGNPIIVRQTASGSALPSIAQACKRTGTSI
jgi:hypothetical protein